jgi:hypothetical protein
VKVPQVIVRAERRVIRAAMGWFNNSTGASFEPCKTRLLNACAALTAARKKTHDIWDR